MSGGGCDEILTQCTAEVIPQLVDPIVLYVAAVMSLCNVMKTLLILLCERETSI